MDYTKVNQAGDNICNAMTMLAEATIKKYKTDKTVFCNIVSLEEGYYIVSEDGMTNFPAFANDGNVYKRNDSVYVLIPNGDYTAQKFIIGKHYNEDDLKIINNPLKNFIKTNDLLNMKLYRKISIKPKDKKEYITSPYSLLHTSFDKTVLPKGYDILSEQQTVSTSGWGINATLGIAFGATIWDWVKKELIEKFGNSYYSIVTKSGKPQFIINWDKIDIKDEENWSSVKTVISPNTNQTEKLIGSYDITDPVKFADCNRLYFSGIFTTLLKQYSLGSFGVRLDIKANTNDDHHFRIFPLYLNSSEMIGNIYNLVHSEQKVVFDISSFYEIERINVILYQNNDFIQNNNVTLDKGSVMVENISLQLGYNGIDLTDNTIYLHQYKQNEYYNINNKYKSIHAVFIFKDEEQNKWRRITDYQELDQYSPWELKTFIYDENFIQEDPENNINPDKWKATQNTSKYDNMYIKDFECNPAYQKSGIAFYFIETNNKTHYYKKEIIFLNNEELSMQKISQLDSLQLLFRDETNGNYHIYANTQQKELLNNHDGDVVREIICGYDLKDELVLNKDYSFFKWYINNTQIKNQNQEDLGLPLKEISVQDISLSAENSKVSRLTYKLAKTFTQNSSVQAEIKCEYYEYGVLIKTIKTIAYFGCENIHNSESKHFELKLNGCFDELIINNKKLKNNKKIEIEAELYDKNKLIEINSTLDNVFKNMKYEIIKNGSVVNNINCKVIVSSGKILFTIAAGEKDLGFYRFKIWLNDQGDQIAINQIAIPYSKNNSCTLVQGADKIIYGKGDAVSFSAYPYKISGLRDTSKITWGLIDSSFGHINKNTPGYPTIKNQVLKPFFLYVEALQSFGIATYTTNDELVYAQEIIVIKEGSQSLNLNDYTENLLVNANASANPKITLIESTTGEGRYIDESDGAKLTGMFIGKKKIDTKKPNGNITSQTSEYGLWGFQNGEPIVGLGVDGENYFTDKDSNYVTKIKPDGFVVQEKTTGEIKIEIGINKDGIPYIKLGDRNILGVEEDE